MNVVMTNILQPIFACAVCTGQLDDAASHAANLGIGVMLLVLFGVFTGVMSFIVSLARRSRQMAAETDIKE